MGKKSKKPVKEKAPVQLRTKQERQEEVRSIISSLTQYQLTSEYKEIKDLMSLLHTYIETGTRLEINIPFKEINRCIKGVLAVSKRENVWIKLEPQKY